MNQNRMTQAIYWAKQGFRIIPLQPKSKIPTQGTRWKEIATTNESVITAWFGQHPDCNYGIVLDGYVAVDVEDKKGRNGFEDLKRLGIELPRTHTTKSINGQGAHYIYSTDGLPISPLNLGSFELRTGNQYIVGAGCHVVDKKTGADGVYHLLDDSSIVTLPACIRDLALAKRDKPANSAESETARIELDGALLDQAQQAQLQNLLDGIDADLDYPDWIRAIFAAFNVYGYREDTARCLQHWSKKGKKYGEAEFWAKVASYDPDREDKVGYPALLELSRSYPVTNEWLPYCPEAEIINRKVFDRVIAMLTEYGNHPSAQHAEGLQAICRAMAHGLYADSEKFRIAFPLETGMGKTTCVVALAAEAQHTEKSLLISAERIEQLDELRQDMIKAGVNPNRIGIYHSSQAQHRDIQSVTLGEMSQVQFLLVSHTRIKNDSLHMGSDRLMAYQGRRRDLVIWDESLLTSNGFHLSREQVIRAINDWQTTYRVRLEEGQKSKSRPEQFEAFDAYLGKVRENLEGDMQIMQLPFFHGDIEDYRQIVRSMGQQEDFQATLNKLLEFSNRGELRIVKTSNGTALVQFIQTIDDSFDRVAVLDASARIRDLVTYDKSISRYPMKVSKDYSTVTIHHGNVLSSKSSFGNQLKHLENHLKEIEHLLKTSIPKSEEVLIFCLREQKEALERWRNENHPFRGITILHWGEHRATNRFSRIRYMITVGVLYRNVHELAASILGQTRSLSYALVDQDIKQVQVSEQSEMLYQGISRGHSRKTIDGKAGEQVIYLFHPQEHAKPVLKLLEKVMPNIQIKEYRPAYLARTMHSNAESYRQLSERIRNWLLTLAPSVKEVSVRKLRETVAPTFSANSKTWRNAIGYAERELLGWVKQGQTLVRR